LPVFLAVLALLVWALQSSLERRRWLGWELSVPSSTPTDSFACCFFVNSGISVAAHHAGVLRIAYACCPVEACRCSMLHRKLGCSAVVLPRRVLRCSRPSQLLFILIHRLLLLFAALLLFGTLSSYSAARQLARAALSDDAALRVAAPAPRPPRTSPLARARALTSTHTHTHTLATV